MLCDTYIMSAGNECGDITAYKQCWAYTLFWWNCRLHTYVTLFDTICYLQRLAPIVCNELFLTDHI